MRRRVTPSLNEINFASPTQNTMRFAVSLISLAWETLSVGGKPHAENVGATTKLQLGLRMRLNVHDIAIRT